MGARSWVFVCALLPACSFAFVNEPNDAMLRRQQPLDCTRSRALPVTDLVLTAAIAAAVFATVYSAVEDFNEDCSPGGCYTPWKPALLGAFLVASPSGISSAVGFSETHQCRKAFRALGFP